ncbi:PIN domain-containing protein [Pseudomonas simiae]|uniref:PIN domain-containing protein n=1 Tax=Pseudomonas simiae TaxID=321846 RepID=UPI001F534472|nr:PIN domain-containing protein [Pseudomonas simiae]UNK65223.1 PIN domain-containing protein [Pseudomonas simiae]
MKGLFPQYDYSTPADYEETWKTALFVFDTNVLLNLYRYQERTREELFETFDKLADRVWIPHHVALEFQRNRLTVIAAQGRRFTEIRKVIDKTKLELTNGIKNLQLTKRHTLIDPEPLTTGFDKLTAEFLSELDKLQENQQALNAPDTVKDRIEQIFDGKVGLAFSSQEDVDKKNKIAETRYKAKMPPGYMDDEKDKDEPDDFYHHGITYKRKYGDYFVWAQILDYAESSQQKKIIFITDDAKEDWWKKIDLDGPKTLGPRAELIDEATNVGKLDTFLMYKPEGFLKFANEFLAAKVSNETLKEVHEVSKDNKKFTFYNFTNKTEHTIMETAVLNWARSKHQNATINDGYPDILATDESDVTGYEVKLFKSQDISKLLITIDKAIPSIEMYNLASLNIVLIVDDYYDADKILHTLKKYSSTSIPDNLNIIFGQISNANEILTFEQLHQVRYNDIGK